MTCRQSDGEPLCRGSLPSHRTDGAKNTFYFSDMLIEKDALARVRSAAVQSKAGDD